MEDDHNDDDNDQKVLAEEEMALMLAGGGLMASTPPVDDMRHPLGVSPSHAMGGGDAKPKRKRRKCSHSDCDNNAKQGGVCITTLPATKLLTA